MGKYRVDRDVYGYAIAIEKNGYYVLHLDRGSDLNEKNIDWVVDALNSLSQDKPNEADALNARLNRIALEMADLDLENPHDLESRRRLNKEYTETYAKLLQLRSDK